MGRSGHIPDIYVIILHQACTLSSGTALAQRQQCYVLASVRCGNSLRYLVARTPFPSWRAVEWLTSLLLVSGVGIDECLKLLSQVGRYESYSSALIFSVRLLLECVNCLYSVNYTVPVCVRTYDVYCMCVLLQYLS